MFNIKKFNLNIEIIDKSILSSNFKINEKDYNDLHDFKMSNIIVQLINNTKNIELEDVECLTKIMPEKVEEIAIHRWKGILHTFNNEFDEAIELLNTSLAMAKSCEVENWIIRDILLDIRNVNITKNNLQQNIMVDSEIQKELESYSNYWYYPHVYRNMYNAINELQKELFNYGTDGPYTTRFGGNLSTSLNDILTALAVSVCYGSYTYINIIIEQLGYILYHYSKIYHDTELKAKSLMLFIKQNNKKVVEKILESDFDSLLSEFDSNIINIICNNDITSEDPRRVILRLFLIEKLGSFLEDKDIQLIQSYVIRNLSIPKQAILGNEIKRSGINAMKGIINRLDTDNIMEILIVLIKENLRLEDDILKLLSRVDFKHVTQGLIIKLLDYLKSRIGKVLTNSSIYNVFSSVYKAYPELLVEINSNLIDRWEQGERSLDTVYYFGINKFNIEKKVVLMLINHLLNIIKDQNDQLTEGSPIGFGGYSMFNLISYYLINYNINFQEIHIFDIYKQVLLNPYQSLENKYDCLDSIVQLIESENPDFSIAYTNIDEFIEDNKEIIIKCRAVGFSNNLYIERLELKLIEVSTRIKQPFHIDSIMSKCIEYGMHAFIDVRLDSLSLVEAITLYSKEDNTIKQFLFSKSFDNYYKIRGDAIVLLSKVSVTNSEWSGIAFNRIRELTNDENSYVRSSIIYLIENNYFLLEKKEQYIEILKVFLHDKHYRLKNRAKAALELLDKC